MGKIRVVTAVVNDETERANEHEGDSWQVHDGVLHVTSNRHGFEASYPPGGWIRVERL